MAEGRAVVPVEPIRNADPFAELVRLILPSAERQAVGSSYRRLIATPSLRGAVVVVLGVGSEDLSNWVRFVSLLAGEARSQHAEHAPVVAVLTSEACTRGAGYQVFDDEGLVSASDVHATIEANAPWLADPIAEAAVAVICEVGRSDAQLIEGLINAGVETAFDPRDWLQTRVRPDSPGTDRWRGKLEPSSIWLAHCEPAALGRRIWRGQVSTLFPWLEELRLETIARHRKHLRPGQRNALGDEITDVEEYEWAQLRIQFSRNAAPKVLQDLAEEALAIRNHLAHGNPLFAGEGRELFKAATAAR